MWALFGQTRTRQQNIAQYTAHTHSTAQYTARPALYTTIYLSTIYLSVACGADGQDRQWVSTWSLANESGDADGESCVTFTKETHV